MENVNQLISFCEKEENSQCNEFLTQKRRKKKRRIYHTGCVLAHERD
jgi:hypothetical protein